MQGRPLSRSRGPAVPPSGGIKRRVTSCRKTFFFVLVRVLKPAVAGLVIVIDCPPVLGLPGRPGPSACGGTGSAPRRPCTPRSGGSECPVRLRNYKGTGHKLRQRDRSEVACARSRSRFRFFEAYSAGRNRRTEGSACLYGSLIHQHPPIANSMMKLCFSGSGLEIGVGEPKVYPIFGVCGSKGGETLFPSFSRFHAQNRDKMFKLPSQAREAGSRRHGDTFTLPARA